MSLRGIREMTNAVRDMNIMGGTNSSLEEEDFEEEEEVWQAESNMRDSIRKSSLKRKSLNGGHSYRYQTGDEDFDATVTAESAW